MKIWGGYPSKGERYVALHEIDGKYVLYRAHFINGYWVRKAYLISYSGDIQELENVARADGAILSVPGVVLAGFVEGDEAARLIQ